MFKHFLPLSVGLLCLPLAASAQTTLPLIKPDVVFEEKDGLVAVEAEHFYEQTKTDKRQWYLVTDKVTPTIEPDGDKPHAEGASGGAYLEALPDTRRGKEDKLRKGDNFTEEGGAMAQLSYKVHFNTPGRYYVWARTFSTNGEDNGIHVGLNGTWPETGLRMQWTTKNKWVWDSKQRTEKNHGGEPYLLYLDIPTAGQHIIHFSMREDGFEFDKWLMTTDRNYKAPLDAGPESRIQSGTLPAPVVAN